MMVGVYILFYVLLFIAFIPVAKKQKSTDLFSKEETNILKGLSAFFVMAAHLQFWVDDRLGVITPSVVRLSVGQLGGIGVLIFFFVSGYGIQESYGDRNVDYKYLLKRLTGVYIPYVIMKFLLLPSLYITGVTDKSVINEIISILLMNDWFIFVIVLQYVMYFISSKFFKKYLITVSVIADFIFTIAFIYTCKPIGWFNALWLFTFGIVVSEYKEQIILLIDKRFIPFLFIMCSAFLLTGVIFAFNKGTAWANVMKPLSGFALCMIFAAVFRILSILSIVSKWAGKRSMHLYVIHITAWNCMNVVQNVIIRLLLTLVITMVVTELIYRFTNYIASGLKRKLEL